MQHCWNLSIKILSSFNFKYFLFSHSQRLYVFQTNTHFETNAENLEKPTSYNKNVQQQEQKPITRTGIVREIAHGVKS